MMIFLAGLSFSTSQAESASPIVVEGRVGGESLLAAPLDSFQGGPVYDSGWYDLGIRPDPLSVLFTHNLGGDPDEYVVDLTCKDDANLGSYNCTDAAFNVNAHWYALTSTTISVWAGSARPDEVRVRIYNITPAYDSGWDVLLSRPDPIAVEFTHNIGRDIGSHMVKLECKDESELGTYDCTDHAFNTNASWYGLNGTTVSAWVDNGPRPDEIRIRLFELQADYDSDWYTILVRPDPLPIGFNHDLRGDIDDYFVVLECKDDSALGTYDCTSFLFNKQAGWYGLEETSITVWVDGGTVPDEVRVRILTPKKLYLPMVMKELCP